jgi:hypothetical protein
MLKRSPASETTAYLAVYGFTSFHQNPSSFTNSGKPYLRENLKSLHRKRGMAV